jgi:hypothetical protein
MSDEPTQQLLSPVLRWFLFVMILANIAGSIGRLRAIAIGSLGGVIGYGAMLAAPSWEWMILAISLNLIPYSTA